MPGMLKRPILVTGIHRSGTTWVGKMLTAGSQLAYISEPLNKLHRPGVMRAPVKFWYTYINQKNEDEYLPALRETLRFRYHAWLELKSLRSFKDTGRMARDASIFLRGWWTGQRPLLKDPFAVFSALWFAQRLDCQVVITVRHPAAFASSLKRLNWPFDFQDLLDQPLLMDDWLEPFRAAMEAMLNSPQDVLSQAALLWRMFYQVAVQFCRQRPDFILVRHEDLSASPVEGFRALYERLSLDFSPRVEQAILASSSAENPKELSRRAVHSVRLDSQANLNNWKRRLDQDEVRRIRSLTEEIAVQYYPEISWE